MSPAPPEEVRVQPCSGQATPPPAVRGAGVCLRVFGGPFPSPCGPAAGSTASPAAGEREPPRTPPVCDHSLRPGRENYMRERERERERKGGVHLVDGR